MKYYSENLKKMYSSEKECLEAEKEYEAAQVKAEEEKKALAAKRAVRAKEIDELHEIMAKAQEDYYNAVKGFVRDYGAYHKTYGSAKDISWPSLLDCFF